MSLRCSALHSALPSNLEFAEVRMNSSTSYCDLPLKPDIEVCGQYSARKVGCRHYSYPNPLYSLRHITGQCDLTTECFAYEVAYIYTDI